MKRRNFLSMLLAPALAPLALSSLSRSSIPSDFIEPKIFASVDPIHLDGMTMWIDAKDGIQMIDGYPSLRDKSGNGNHLKINTDR